MSGWTAATLNFEDEDDKQQADARLRETFTGTRPWTATGYADTTVQVDRGANHFSVAEELAEAHPEAESIAVVSANNTSSSGYGTLFSVANNGQRIEKVDSKEGYEGAKGRDVTGYFSDEYGVRSYASFEA